jgi:hypothetical protein
LKYIPIAAMQQAIIMLCRSGQIFGHIFHVLLFFTTVTLSYRKSINYAKYDEIIDMLVKKIGVFYVNKGKNHIFNMVFLS